jgi:undecaprenyl-diphosphatase
MLQAEPPPSLSQAVALGVLQGPSELLPVSSSAHTTLLPWLLRGREGPPQGASDRSFEIALHAGGALALAIAMRQAGPTTLPGGPRGQLTMALALAPPALAGLALRGLIERRLGGPRSIAVGLVAGAVAMALADAVEGDRDVGQAGPLDGLCLGLAQAAALVPGVSRNGATLAAGRARRFDRGAACSLSWGVGLPVLIGVGALETGRLLARRARPDAAAVAGGAAAFLSTTAAARLLAPWARPRPLLGFSTYRCLLAALVAVRLRRAQ